jgi:tRNA threonylcarbamoyl adenosine modification protein (Sua5/YciO/YrdC/YwlC family)
MLLPIHPDNPEPRKIERAVKILQDGGIIIYPTDSVYALGCDITQARAIERICQLKGIKPNKANFSFICHDLAQISAYAKPFSTAIYRAMKTHLPGPFTFILNANNEVPKLLKSNKKTVGIRVPDHPIAQALIQALGNPILSTSLKTVDDPVIEYPTDPKEIHDEYEHQVDLVIDGGYGNNIPSTVVDCTDDDCKVIRQGAGIWQM